MAAVELVSSGLELLRLIGGVATQSPVTVILVGVGALIIGAPLVGGGVWVVGVAVDLVSGGQRGVRHPRD